MILLQSRCRAIVKLIRGVQLEPSSSTVHVRPRVRAQSVREFAPVRAQVLIRVPTHSFRETDVPGFFLSPSERQKLRAIDEMSSVVEGSIAHVLDGRLWVAIEELTDIPGDG